MDNKLIVATYSIHYNNLQHATTEKPRPNPAEKALMKSSWCSNDPVCMENISIGGDETTLASCYACTLIPETSCEAFNKYLDRAFVTGNPGTPNLGFFEDFWGKR